MMGPTKQRAIFLGFVILTGTGALDWKLAAAGAGTTPTQCSGDCDLNGQTTISELTTLVNIALEFAPITRCPSGDVRPDGVISVDELVLAVTDATRACGDTIEPPHIAVRPAAVLPGDSLLATGTGFGQSPCGVRFLLGSPTGPEIGSTTFVNEGVFTALLVIPAGTSGGNVTVIAQGLLSSGEGCGGASPDEARAVLTILTRTPQSFDLILNRFRFDPLEGEPDLPPEQITTYAPNEEGFHLLQFNGPTQDAWLDQLRDAGVVVIQFQPSFAYIVRVTPTQADTLRTASFVRSLLVYHAAYRLAPAVLVTAPDTVDVSIYDDGDGSAERTVAEIEALGGRLIEMETPPAGDALLTATFALPASAHIPTAQLNGVLWLNIPRTNEPDDERSDQIVAGNFMVGTPVAAGYQAWFTALGLTGGTGITAALIDTGFDTGNNATAHPDVQGRLVPVGTATEGNGHGTHVGGIIAGNGSLGTTAQGGLLLGLGMAPNVTLVARQSTGTNADITSDAVINGAVTSNHSYGLSNASSGYTNNDRTFDMLVRDANQGTAAVAEALIVVFSAGNCGLGPMDGAGPCSGNTGPTKEAKNIIAVANSGSPNGGNINAVAGTSSRGPAQDGRTYPHVAAPGTSIVSTRSSQSPTRCNGAVAGAPATDPTYSVCSGTSMAAPHVTGSVVLLTEWWQSFNGGADPSPAMAKALLINGADDMADFIAVPNNNEGWGRVNLGNVIDPPTAAIYRDQLTTFGTTGDTWTIQVCPDDPSRRMRIGIAWSDAPGPGSGGMTAAWVNDINLTAFQGSSGNTFRGNVFAGGVSTPGGTADSQNNAENVFLQNPSGPYNVTVTATNLAGDGVPLNADSTDQDFAFVCSNCELNAPPVCDANGPYVAECTLPITLDASGSSDPNGDPLTYTWTGPFVGGTATTATPTVAFATLGNFTLNLTVSDSLKMDACSAAVTVQDTLPPMLPPDITTECLSPSGTPVTIGMPSDLCGTVVSSSNDAPALFPLGTTVVNWTATDNSNNTISGTQTITVVDTTPPTLTLSATPAILWPPNHRLVTVDIDLVVTDACDDAPVVRLVDIVSSEPDKGTGPLDKPDDVQSEALDTDDRSFRLRAEHGPDSAREYTITYEATDESGNSTMQSVVVRVPKSRPELVSRDGTTSNGGSVAVGINTDGRFVAFPSDASNLVPLDRNELRDVFVRHRANKTTEIASVASGGGELGNRPSHAQNGGPAVNGDGTIIAFYSEADNLVVGDSNGVADVFVHDRSAGTTERIGIPPAPQEANGGSFYPSISEDGQLVAFQSLASNLVLNDTNGAADIFVYDRVAGTVERVCDSVQGNGPSTRPSISPDGRYVAFASAATNLVNNDGNDRLDIFLCDRSTGGVERVSVSSTGSEGNGDSIFPAISRDGAVVAFKSDADNLVTGDHNDVIDVFVRDRSLGATERVSVTPTGGDADDASFPPSVSHDGRFVAFGSFASNLVRDDANQVANLFVRDRQRQQTLIADVNDDGAVGNGLVRDIAPAITGDGGQIAFVSLATNLGGKANDTPDVFLVCNPFVSTAPAVPPMGP